MQLVIEDTETKQKQINGISDVVWDSLNPKFLHKFMIETDFAEIQNLLFKVYDTEEDEIHNGVPTINPKRFIGEVRFKFVEVMQSFGKKVGKKLMNGSNVVGDFKV